MSSPLTQPTFGAAPPFAPRPQPSAFSSTPILNQPLEEEEPEVIKSVSNATQAARALRACRDRSSVANLCCSVRQWRERQAEEIKKRDEASKAKREETIGKAERAIDQFYEEYAAKKERNIRENKCVTSPSFSL